MAEYDKLKGLVGSSPTGPVGLRSQSLAPRRRFPAQAVFVNAVQAANQSAPAWTGSLQVGDLAIAIGGSNINVRLTATNGYVLGGIMYEAGQAAPTYVAYKTLTAGDISSPVAAFIGGFTDDSIIYLVYHGAVAARVRRAVQKNSTIGWPATAGVQSLNSYAKKNAYAGTISFHMTKMDKAAGDIISPPAGFTPRIDQYNTTFRQHYAVADKLYGYNDGDVVTWSSTDTSHDHVSALIELLGSIPTATTEATSSVPVMTSNSTPVGHAASASNLTGSAFAVFDGSTADSATESTNNAVTIVTRQFPSPMMVGKVSLTTGTTGPGAPQLIVIEGSEDGLNWVGLAEPNQGASTTVQYALPTALQFDFFQYYRYRDVFGAAGLNVNEITFYRAA